MNHRTHVTPGIVIAAILALAAMSPMASANAQSPNGQTLAGAWLIDATPAQAIVPPFKMLMTFHADGTLVETQNDLLAPPFFGTTGHGVWEKLGPNSYTFTMVQLLFDPNFTGTYFGTLKSRANITLDETGLTGRAVVQVADADGTVLFSGDGSLKGTRIVSEPLN